LASSKYWPMSVDPWADSCIWAWMPAIVLCVDTMKSCIVFNDSMVFGRSANICGKSVSNRSVALTTGPKSLLSS
jgi:hypothetical protein